MTCEGRDEEMLARALKCHGWDLTLSPGQWEPQRLFFVVVVIVIY